MKSEAGHQLSLPLSGDAKPRLIKTTRAANKKRGRAISIAHLQCAMFAEQRHGYRVEVRYKRRYSLEVIRDADHPVEIEMSGPDHDRHVRERAARALSGTFEPLPGVPVNRGACPPERVHTGCPYVRCRYHLWRIDGGIDGTRAGRPGLSRVPRNELGLTVRFPGDMGGDRPPSTLLPRWLEPGPIAPSCALDEIDQHGKMGNEQTGHAMARHRTLVARELRSGTKHAIENAEERGMDSADLIGALMRMGDKPRGT